MSPMPFTKCAVCCKRSGLRHCDRCKSCACFSKACQQADWTSHRLLCRDLAEQPARPSPDHVRAVFFPADSARPQLVCIPCRRLPEDQMTPYDAACEFSQGFIEREFLGLARNDNTRAPAADDNDDEGGWRTFWGVEAGAGVEHVRVSHRVDAVMPRMLRFYFRDNFCNDGWVPTAGVIKSVRPHGPDKRHWKGPLVAVALSVAGGERHTAEDLMLEGITGGGRHDSDDFTLADFRAVFDYSLGFPREPSELSVTVIKNPIHVV